MKLPSFKSPWGILAKLPTQKLSNALLTVLVTSTVFGGVAEAAIFAGLVNFACGIYKELVGDVAFVVIGISVAIACLMALVGENKGVFSTIAKVLVWGGVLVAIGAIIIVAIPTYRLPSACS